MARAVCPLCPNRTFKNTKALNAHRADKHADLGYYCKCSKVFQSQEALEQHVADKHPSFKCHYCNREFATDNGRSAHEQKKHLTHQKAKHYSTLGYECRGSATDEGSLAHQKDSPKFGCGYCDSEFKSESAREQHKCAQHGVFKCFYCGCEFSSLESRWQHQDEKHTTFKCTLCGESFYFAESLRWHQKVPHSKCKYCTSMFYTQHSKTAHEVSCVHNPVRPLTSTLFDRPLRPGSQSSGNVGSTEIAEEEGSISTSTERIDEGFESPASPSSSNFSLGEGEMLHSTSGVPDDRPCRCEHSLEHCSCSICVRLSGANEAMQDDRKSVVPSDDNRQSGSTVFHDVAFRCMLCMVIYDAEEASRGHICATPTIMLRPHCPHCYSQFDDAPSLQQHLEGLQSVSCQLCLTHCCSDEMMQDHLLTHPTCSKCGEPFTDDLALCAHVESDHPAVVCWDCNGVVVEHSTLELHYADSPAHPSCMFCGLGKRNAAEMDEHIKHAHPGAEIEHPESNNVSLDTESPEGTPGMNRDNTVRDSSSELDRTPVVAVGQPGDKIRNSPLQRESSLSSSPQRSIPLEIEGVNEVAANALDASGEESPDASVYMSLSPAPSEHSSNINVSQMRLHASGTTHAAVNNDTRPPSPVSTVSAEAFSDLSTQNSSTTSSHSIVFVSADGIPDYIRENRAVLVGGSAGSPSSGRTPLRLPSWSSLESLEMIGRSADAVSAPASAPAPLPPHRLHCRICMRDPCEDMTATICGHLFCKRCITQAVVAKSECPVCKSATLLYCLFKLDLSA